MEDGVGLHAHAVVLAYALAAVQTARDDARGLGQQQRQYSSSGSVTGRGG